VFAESVKYYNKRGSKVYCAFLDASKAFEKCLSMGLLLSLLKEMFQSFLHRFIGER